MDKTDHNGPADKARNNTAINPSESPPGNSLGETLCSLVRDAAGKLLVIGRDGAILYANQHACRFLAVGEEAGAVSRRVDELLSFDRPEAWQETCRQVLAAHVPKQRRFEITSASGSGWFDCSLTPIQSGDPPVRAIVVHLIDAASPSAQQENLRLAEEQYRILFESMQEGVVHFGSASSVLCMNPAAQHILGYTTDEYRRRSRDESGWRIFYDDGPRITPENNPVARCFATGRPESGIILRTFQPRLGQYIWIVVNVTPLFSSGDPRPWQVIATFNEITDRIRLRESRKARMRLLEESGRWSTEELLGKAIDLIGELTDSPVGFYHFVQGGPTRAQMWPSATLRQSCTIELASHMVDLQNQGGLFEECLRQGQVVVGNDFGTREGRNRLPVGHVDLDRVLMAPVLRHGRTVAILGVGNKHCDYGEEDVALARDFGDLIWDLVEQKRLERERQESRRKLNALIGNLPGVVFSAEDNSERSLHFVSDGCLELTGYSAGELLARPGASLAALIHPDDRARVNAAVRKSVSDLRPYEIEYRLLSIDGREMTALERASSLVDRDSGKVMIEGFITDITEQKLAAERLARSHRMLRTILDSIEALIFVADIATHEILFVNRKMRETFGDDLTGRFCFQVLQRKDEPCDFCSSCTLPGQRDEPWQVSRWENYNPVTKRWYVNYDRMVRWIDDKPVRMQVAFDDTERKESEIKLRQVQKMEAIGLLAGGVAHDFNNILSVILGYATMAMEELGERAPKVRRDLLQIERAGNRARDLVRQILSFCHRSEEHLQALKPHLIIKEVVKMLRSSFPSTIQVYSQIATMDRMVKADPSQIHQVLMNLSTNALHAMKGGGELVIGLDRVELEEGETRRELRDLPRGSYLRLSVRDTGAGIPADLLDKIFDPFFTTKGEDEGTGLGLAVVQGIAVSHNGTVTVDSRVGEGSTFSVYLPEYQDAVVEEAPASSQSLPGGTERILVIDDEPAVAQILQRLLRSLGYTVTAFTESPKAFEVYTANATAFDLVITDMTMPRFTGLAVARAMLVLRPKQPIIICTGFSDSIDEESAKAEGIRELLAKPVSLENLARAVRRALNGGPESMAGARD